MSTNVEGNEYPELVDMDTYIGTKISKAKPMSRIDYNVFKGWALPADENPADEGFIVQYEDGYISWSPKKQFDDAYHKTVGMNFGLAIEAMRKGHKVSRAGWNGKCMWVSLSAPKSTHWIPEVDGQVKRTFSDSPYFCMKTADGSLQPGWLASQADMLAFDWGITE
jgi:hypothetical protein